MQSRFLFRSPVCNLIKTRSLSYAHWAGMPSPKFFRKEREEREREQQEGIQTEPKNLKNFKSFSKIPVTVFRPGYRVDFFCLNGLSNHRGITTEVEEFQQMTTGLKLEFPASLLNNRDFFAFVRLIRYPETLQSIHQVELIHRDYQVRFSPDGGIRIITIGNSNQVPNLNKVLNIKQDN